MKITRATLVCICLTATVAVRLQPLEANEVPRLEVTPERAFIDEKVSIVLRDFPAGQPVTVQVRSTDNMGRTWESHADFLADGACSVDLAAQPPLSGTYQRADARGLFWSMSLPPDDRTRGEFGWSGRKSIEFHLTAEIGGKAVATTNLGRLFVADGVKRISVREAGLRGSLFIPSGGGRHPGVMVLGGSGGGLHEGTAAFLASKGYAALALAYFSFEDLPKSLENIPLEYFETGIHWLKGRREVLDDKIAVLGESRGGELALLLGATFREFGAVVAVVPSGMVWAGLGATDSAEEQPAWTYHGRPVPFLSERDLTPEQVKEMAAIPQVNPTTGTPYSLIMLENRAAVEKAAIAVEKINGPVLLISGTDDQMWPSSVMSDMVMQRLTAAKHPFPDRHLSYERAGHAIPFPNMPTTVNYMHHPIANMDVAFGGSPEADAAAADSWEQIVDFLRASIGR